MQGLLVWILIPEASTKKGITTVCSIEALFFLILRGQWPIEDSLYRNQYNF